MLSLLQPALACPTASASPAAWPTAGAAGPMQTGARQVKGLVWRCATEAVDCGGLSLVDLPALDSSLTPTHCNASAMLGCSCRLVLTCCHAASAAHAVQECASGYTLSKDGRRCTKAA